VVPREATMTKHSIRLSGAVFALSAIILLATGNAYAQRGGGVGGHTGYSGPKAPPTQGTSKPIKCRAGGAGCQRQH
jgi:hypothetical protein